LPPAPAAFADEAAWLLSVQDALGRVSAQARQALDDPPGMDRSRRAWPVGCGGNCRLALASLAVLAVLAVVGWIAAVQAPRSSVPQEPPSVAATVQTPPQAVAAEEAAPKVALTPAPAPRVALVADAADTGLADALAGALALEDGLQVPLLNARGWSEALERLAVDQPRVALLRYDALRLAQRAAPSPLAVVAPLVTQELQVVVRTQAPQRYLHELRGLRINAGPGPGARRLSARTLYEALFGEPLPATPGSELDEAAALQALHRGELDAVVLIGTQPAPALAGLPPQASSGLRLLVLAPRHPASRRALDAFLPSRLHGDRFPPGLVADDAPTLALMSFLVTTGQRTAPADAALARLAAALCRALPALALANPAWAAVNLRLRLPTGLPTAAPAEAALHDCAPLPMVSTVPTAAAPVPPPR
jgi:TRAP-type uncharacterized transport system substrate-binding protein